MIRPIAIGLAPNLEIDDIILTAKNLLFGKVFYNQPRPLEELKSWFKSNYNTRSVYLFNSARSGLYIILNSLNIGAGDEVIVPSFTCVAVPNAVIWNKANPRFVDINKNTLGIDINDLEKKINNKTKAIIIQHTFGIPCEIEKIINIAKKYNLIVIEDCAHGINIPYKDKYLGQFGDLSFFSFGRDKAISSVFGGALIINNYKYNKNLKILYSKIKYPSVFWILKQHFHSILMALVLPTYNIELGKLILFLAKKLNLITMPVYEEEKKGQQPSDFPAKLHSSLAILVLHQLSKLGRFNSHRSKIVEFYSGGSRSESLLRYPVIVKNRDQILKQFKKKNIVLGNWYSMVFDPVSCPTAEYVAQHIINLPTYPTFNQNQAEKIINILPKNSIL